MKFNVYMYMMLDALLLLLILLAGFLLFCLLVMIMPIVSLLVMVTHQLTLILVLSPLGQSVRDINHPPLVEDMALCLQLLGQSLDSSSSSMFTRVIILGLFSSVLLSLSMMLLVLFVGFFVGSGEVESGWETDHHISALVKHG